MNTPNEDGKQPDKTELGKEQGGACCGPGCGCGSGGGPGSGPGKMRWVLGAVVLVVAGLMVVRAVVKNAGAGPQAAEAGFVNPLAAPQAAGVGLVNPLATLGETASGGTNAEAVQSAGGASAAATLGAFAELNTVAAKTDAVFVFVPAKEGGSTNAPMAAMKAAARTIEGKGVKCSLFTLKPGSPDYDQIAKQMALPAVVALVKGKGMSAISGEVTEAKLVQGYVAAGSAGGCCSSASPGCCAK